MTSSRTTLAGAVALALVLMAAAAELQALRERVYPPSAEDDGTLYVTSPRAAQRLALAYPALAADIYWIRAIQYYGGTKQKLQAALPGVLPPPFLSRDPSAGYPLLYPLLDLTTSLDPRFNVAYRFGAVFLAEAYPNGPGRPDLAVQLLQKGLRERPDKWEYMEDIGFVHYWYTHDYRTAAQWFQKASEVSGAPWWLKSLAATTLAQGGDRASSRQIWESIRSSAEVDWLRRDAERRLLQFRALDELDRLNATLAAFASRTGERPTDWRTLVRAGVVPGVPVDPTRMPYLLDAEGRVVLSPRSALYPLPDEPQSTPGRQ